MDGISIKSQIGRTLISKIINSAVKKKLGHDINVQVEEITVSLENGKVHVHLSTDADIPVSVLSNLL